MYTYKTKSWRKNTPDSAFPRTLSTNQIFIKSLNISIIFNSVTLENTQTEPQKYFIFFNETNNV